MVNKAGKFFWLKMEEGFFQKKEIKKLLKHKDGYLNLIIFQKMQLLSLSNSATIIFSGIEETIEQEIALEIDHDDDEVKSAIEEMKKCNLIICHGTNEIEIPMVLNNLGVTTKEAERKRIERAEKKPKTFGQNSDIVQDCPYIVQDCPNVSENRPIEIEIEIELDIEIELEKELEKKRKEKDPIFFEDENPSQKKMIQFEKIDRSNQNQIPTIEEIQAHIDYHESKFKKRYDAKEWFIHWDAQKWVDRSNRPFDWRRKINDMDKDQRFWIKTESIPKQGWTTPKTKIELDTEKVNLILQQHQESMLKVVEPQNTITFKPITQIEQKKEFDINDEGFWNDTRKYF